MIIIMIWVLILLLLLLSLLLVLLSLLLLLNFFLLFLHMLPNTIICRGKAYFLEGNSCKQLFRGLTCKNSSNCSAVLISGYLSRWGLDFGQPEVSSVCFSIIYWGELMDILGWVWRFSFFTVVILLFLGLKRITCILLGHFWLVLLSL